LDIPENFGLTVGLKSVQRETGMPILWTYDIVVEEGSFGAMLHLPEALQDLYEYIPRGFYWFASKYYDHPIVTGQDGELISRTVEEEMALALEINAYVNNTYTYASENTDDWEFMGQGRPAGDCEDFMLTKAQMMIDAGISIQNIKLDCGFPDETSEETFVSGHAWLLYRNQYVMDTSSNSFKTVAEMMVRYPRRRTQISGLTWYCEGFIKTIPVDSLWPTHEVDIKILDFDCYIKKLTR
jgi:predicted transglutaminase-like cysteine proteinase